MQHTPQRQPPAFLHKAPAECIKPKQAVTQLVLPLCCCCSRVPSQQRPLLSAAAAPAGDLFASAGTPPLLGALHAAPPAHTAQNSVAKFATRFQQWELVGNFSKRSTAGLSQTRIQGWACLSTHLQRRVTPSVPGLPVDSSQALDAAVGQGICHQLQRTHITCAQHNTHHATSRHSTAQARD